jgi:hypothetical protein
MTKVRQKGDEEAKERLEVERKKNLVGIAPRKLPDPESYRWN